MPDYSFYTGEYLGNSVPVGDFSRIAKRASDQLARYKRIYTVIGDEKAQRMAVCAMMDALYYFEIAANGGIVTSSSIGSVSSSAQVQAVDLSAKAQSKELYRCACLYLDIYRGVGQ